MAETLQILGALLILAPFALLQSGRWQADSACYVMTNLSGSSLLGVLALLERQWGFLLLEACWAAVAGWAAVKLVQVRLRATS